MTRSDVARRDRMWYEIGPGRNDVLTIILAACLAQTDWSRIETRRDLTPEELSEARDLLAESLRSYGIDELTKQADGIQVLRGHSTPVVFLEVVTLDEQRSLQRHTEPYDGPQFPAPTVQDADPWGPPLPAWDEYRDQGWALPVEGSESSRTCPDCRGQRELPCATCGTNGIVQCARCRGKGEVTCTSCSGSGHVRCTSCGGDGRKRSFGKNKTCSSCGGSGHRSCSSCRGGIVTCPTCRGKRQVECQACHGKKRLACARCKGKGGLRSDDSILIRLVAESRASTWTRLQGDRKFEAPIAGWTSVTQDGLDEAASRIADEGLRGHVLALAKQARESAAHLRGQVVRLAEVPCEWVEYEVEGTSRGALLLDREIVEEDSPAFPWAASKVAEAERLLAAGNLNAADHAARLALSVTPDDARALSVVQRVQASQHEAASQPAANSREEDDVKLGLHGIVGIGVLVAALLMVVFALARNGARRWRRPPRRGSP